jgi:exopolysaccharide production protein ExoZ
MLINVQFLRFAAALLVLVYHTSSHLHDAGVGLGPVFALIEATGFAGVDIFFVISGFIMAYTTKTSAGPAQGWLFIRRRFARIYSGYWPFYLLALLVYAWINPAYLETSSLIRSAILWPANVLLIAVSWTLIFEMFFYLLFTFLIVLTERRRLFVLGALLMATVSWSLISHFCLHAYDQGQLEKMGLAQYYMLSPYLAEFLAGALLAGQIGKKPGEWAWFYLLSGVLLFSLGGWVNTALFEGRIEQGYFVFYRVLTFGIPSLLLLKGMIALEHFGMRAPARISILAGGASYAIYLSHTLLLTVSQYLGFNDVAGQLSNTPANVMFWLLILAILLLSMAHYTWIERPLHRWIKRVLRVQ